MSPNAKRVLTAITPFLDRKERFNGTAIALDLSVGQGHFVELMFQLVDCGIIRRVKPGHYVWHHRPDDLGAPEPVVAPKPQPKPNMAAGLKLSQLMAGR
jgi:hypothetical protein